MSNEYNDYEILSAYLDRELSDADRERVEAQLSASPEWRAEYDRLKGVDDMLVAQTMETPNFVGDFLDELEEKTKPTRIWHYALAAAAIVLVIAAVYALLPGGGGSSPDPGHTPGMVAVPQDLEPAAPEDEPMQVAEAPVEAYTGPVKTTLPPLVLVGTITGNDPVATIKNTETDETGAYSVGETLSDGATVTDIGIDYTIIEQNGQRFVLAISKSPQPEELPLPEYWHMGVRNADEVLVKQPELYRLAVDQGEIVVTNVEDDIVIMKGWRSGSTINATINAQGNPANWESGENLLEIVGELNADLSEIVFKLAQTVDPAMFGPDQDPYQLRLHLTQVDQAEINGVLALADAKAEVQQIADALTEYRKANRTLPPTLSELAPDYLADAALVKNDAARQISYSPELDARDMPEPFEVLRDHPEWADDLEGFREYMIEWERDAEKRLGPAAQMYQRPVLVVEYADPDVTYQVTHMPSGSLEVAQVGINLDESPNQAAAVRSSCQNNLKQLGLVYKMFENENGGFTPPGWHATVPRYLTDTSILTSPKDPPGTDSYLYLLPAVHTETLLAEIAEDSGVFNENPAVSASLQSQIPVAMNRTDFPGPNPGRNVLFLDGHVQYVQTDSDDWKNNIEPFLK